MDLTAVLVFAAGVPVGSEIGVSLDRADRLYADSYGRSSRPVPRPSW
jgi:hypothetical protein